MPPPTPTEPHDGIPSATSGPAPRSGSQVLRQLLRSWLLSASALPWWLLFAFLLVSNTASVRLSVALNEWNGRFFNALQKVDAPAIYDALFDFIWLAAVIISLLVLAQYAKNRLLLSLRRELTFRLIDRWLSNAGAHYVLRESGREPDNPDQRIIEDARSLMSLVVNLSLSFIESVLTIGSFSLILWNLSGSITVLGFTIPGYMFWVCLSYTIVATLVTHWIGHPLKNLNFTGQHKEADLRYAFIEKRRYADAIAGAQGEARERENLKTRFLELYDVLVHLVKKQRDLDFFTVGLGQVTHLAPIFFALPSLLAGTIQLGGLMQIRGAFTDVARSFSWFIFAYDDLARLAATWERLAHLLNGLAEAEETRRRIEGAAEALPSAEAAAGETAQARLVLTLPHEEGKGSSLPARRTAFTLAARRGRLVFVTGESGAGKSTFLKTIAGFYENFTGVLRKSGGETIFWVPQKPYLLKGTLRENLAYPAPPESLPDEACMKLLADMELGHLAHRIDEAAEWANVLSGGEQQRVLLIRAVLARPDLLLLDEMTSALDEDAAARILAQLRTLLPETAVVMVSHQDGLSRHADAVVRAEPSPAPVP